MSDLRSCTKTEWIDNEWICKITGKPCIYSTPNQYECMSIYGKYIREESRNARNRKS